MKRTAPRYALLLLSLLGTAWSAATEQAFPAAGIHTLRVGMKEGLIQINGMNTDTITVTTDKRRGDDKCQATINPKVGSTFEVKTDHGLLKGRSCDIDLTLIVPAQLQVEANVGAGTLVVAGLRGDLELNAGSGEIRGTVASANVRSHVGTGKVQLVWDTKPAGGAAHADVGTGNITFEFPKETAARVDVRTGLGKLRNQIITNPQAPFAVTGNIGVGSVDLKYSE